MAFFITQSRYFFFLSFLFLNLIINKTKQICVCFCVERDLARQLIVRALDGLGEGDRFRTILPSLDVDMDTLNNFVHGFVVVIFLTIRKMIIGQILYINYI